MHTFAELLTEYTARAGIPDAELARAVGVQRQTIFRWKEGLVLRPRSAEDVTRLAAKLRLTGPEEDALLLAAGFAPHTPPDQASAAPAHAVVLSAAVDAQPSAAQELLPGRRPLSARTRQLLLAALALVAVAGLIAFGIWYRDRFPRAQADETLIVVGQFANYTGGTQGYNVAGRLRDALAQELTAQETVDMRAAVWPAVIADAVAAAGAGQRSHASLVIWGEYDSGRVLTRLTVPGAAQTAATLEHQVVAPAELHATINGELPAEVRLLALLTLGQVYTDRGDLARARGLLNQALNQPIADQTTFANVHFLLGYGYQVGQPADLDAAIAAYSAALTARPDLLAATHNRALAYLKRGAADDAARAVADLDAILVARPDDAVAWLNRGAAYLQRGGADNAALAVADLDRSLALVPQNPAAHFNRGLAHVKLDQTAAWQADFSQTLALSPGHPGALHGLCWGYTLDEEPETALPYCEQAVAADGQGPALDSLGLALAQLGRYAEAEAAIRAYLAALPKDQQPAAERAARYQTWLAALRAGQNPFDAATLAVLRQE